MTSPRDRYIAVYGRRSVAEALSDEALEVAKVLVAEHARGPEITEIERTARRRGVDFRRVPAREVTRVSRNGRHDQGVVADVVVPAMRALADWIASAGPASTVLVLDGITNPQNLGMILRTATAAAVDGVVVPTAGVADLGPLVIKASAGVAFAAPVVRTRTANEAVTALRAAGFRVHGLVADAPRSVFDPRPFDERSAFVLGNEHEGVRVEVDVELAIPMAGPVESLNVAVAAGVLCFELLRRKLA